jgi:gamma-glutamyltranspeptidase/glutathione hydrolase
LPPGVAAGHRATARAGLEVLEDGGSAADAAISACFASCVCEVVMTGLLGGGHGMIWSAAEGRAHQLDFFTSVPGLGSGSHRRPRLVEMDVSFGEELIRYEIGPESCAVPGIPAGLHELWRGYGRLDWPRLLEPAIRLSREGVSMSPAHAACLKMLAPVLTLDRGEQLFAPGGRLLEAGELLLQPGIAAALELLAEDTRSLYSGALSQTLLELMSERGGLVTSDDLDSYSPLWREPVETFYAGTRFLTRGGLSGVPEALTRLVPLAGLPARERVHALLAAFGGEVAGSHTTNLVAVDEEGNACVLTTSLGLGSGDYLPGFDLHLNSMLGEKDLVSGELEPGERVKSMTAPSIAVDERGPVLAIGAAGGTRLRSALVQVASGILDEGLAPADAVGRPRFHPASAVMNAEPGVDEEALCELEAKGWQVRRWSSLHHYFGGVSAIGRAGAAGDPRRSGVGLLLE